MLFIPRDPAPSTLCQGAPLLCHPGGWGSEYCGLGAAEMSELPKWDLVNGKSFKEGKITAFYCNIPAIFARLGRFFLF
jgi:hypothetical protein